MSEKVVLTLKEIDGVKAAIESCNGDRGRVLKHHGMPNQTWQNSCAPLREMPFDKLARALFIGWLEPTPQFEAGDLIINERTGVLVELNEQTAELTNTEYWDKANVRHATPEEIYWMHELGRDKVGDFREGDVIITQEVSYRYSMDEEVDTIGPETTKLWMDQGVIKGIYPAESFKPFKKEQTK